MQFTGTVGNYYVAALQRSEFRRDEEGRKGEDKELGAHNMSPAPTITSLLGALVILYLSSLVFFAIVRIITGVSIRRLGYLSLRGIGYAKNGVQLDIKRIGLVLHRPTFSQPTWISLIIREAAIVLEPV